MILPMMKRKFGTVLDEEVLRAAKVLAAKEGRKLSELIEEALREYLKRRRAKGVVERSQALIPAGKDLVQRILAEEEFFGR